MKPFSLEEYLKNPSMKVITRNGRKVRIICTDRRSETYPIVSLIETEYGEETCWHAKNGEYVLHGLESNNDLFFAPERHEGWVNVYSYFKNNIFSDTCIYNSKEEAEEIGKKSPYYITTVKVEWEE